MTLETVAACPVCGNKQFKAFLTARDHTVTNESFQLQQCPHCELVLTNPRPDQESVGKYYQSSRYISHTGGGTSLVDRVYRVVRRRAIRNKVKLISNSRPAGRLLDYGCGTGQFLEACQIAGWKCEGVEPSEDARKKLDPALKVHPTVETIAGPYDVITLWHVLEHVHQLNATLDKLKSSLSRGGTIFIAVPNWRSHDAQYYQEYWAGYDVPRHLWHFATPTLIKLLSQHDLKVTGVVPMKFDAFYVSLLSESYRRPARNISNMFRGLLTGLISNLRARPANYSSLIYIVGT